MASLGITFHNNVGCSPLLPRQMCLTTNITLWPRSLYLIPYPISDSPDTEIRSPGTHPPWGWRPISSAYLSLCLSVRPSVHPSIRLSVCLPAVFLSVCLSACLSVFLSVYLSVYLAIYPHTYPPTHLPIYLSLLSHKPIYSIYLTWPILSNPVTLSISIRPDTDQICLASAYLLILCLGSSTENSRGF